jgi:DNA-binding beta-propeller fold protein YncE
VTTGLLPNVRGIVYDGANIWISGLTGGALGNIRKLDSNGAALQSVTVGMYPGQLVFDGTNLWVPNRDSGTVSVVRASSGVVLATLTGNGLDVNGPEAAAFDGQRVLVTMGGLAKASVWKAADLSPLGSFSTGAVTDPFGACSDGLNFWIALTLGNSIARF